MQNEHISSTVDLSFLNHQLSLYQDKLDHNIQLSQYNAGLKALLAMLPDDTDSFPQQTIDDYLWVVELMLSGIYLMNDQQPSANFNTSAPGI